MVRFIHRRTWLRGFSSRVKLSEAGGGRDPASAVHVRGPFHGDSPMVLREVGCTRSLFLLTSHLTGDQIESLASRLKILSKNDGINSVLISSPDDDDNVNDGLPLSVSEIQKQNDLIDVGITLDGQHVYHFFGGIDPLEIFKSGIHRDEDALQHVLDGVASLAVAMRGEKATTRVPIITVPHGLVTDGGYALCMGSYVLATRDTSFRITNPSRGLSFDPIGLSFVLSRLGWEYQQASADYPGCGLILAMTGMEANAADMMDTDLATHFIDSPSAIGTLERSLSQLKPWNQQGLVKEKPRLYGQPLPEEDVNAPFRNVAVAYLLHAVSSYHATGRDMFTSEESDFHMGEDPSLNLDHLDWHAWQESDLVNYAATFDDIFKREKTPVGILERLREISYRESDDEGEKAASEVARDLVDRMEQQSPLALTVVHKLMQLGGQPGETLEDCMEREKRAQAKLFASDDFEAWARHTMSGSKGSFGDWKYRSLEEVPMDVVEEVVG
eukprot:CAMPEP_0116834398 /NCGR_PEP_ID=MMETSP0418-20121206/6969_1 /TAXON_ID=1158023 /ORGANISM="Astrosyne radiata, Strain 13vi08-1A" /LENGTH=498 /DNA_ID=CAMNT_0004463953 /DNA_START=51 /DNA_END=1547 /DNA_ORIENTATION=-